MIRKTKIVCTLGPSSESYDVLKDMVLAGMSVARFNMAHGSYEEHQRRIDLVKEYDIKNSINEIVKLAISRFSEDFGIGSIKINASIAIYTKSDVSIIFLSPSKLYEYAQAHYSKLF